MFLNLPPTEHELRAWSATQELVAVAISKGASGRLTLSGANEHPYNRDPQRPRRLFIDCDELKAAYDGSTLGLHTVRYELILERLGPITLER